LSEREPTREVARLRLTRRELLKAAQVAGLGACAAGVGLVGGAWGSTRTVTGVCRICTAHCGIVATVRGDRVVRVDGDPKSPLRGFICQHGFAIPEIIHADDRVRRPLKREGGRFREIPWSQALAEIADRLQQIKKEYGPQALAIHTGWPFVRHPLVPFLLRFAHAFGSPNVSTVASLCEAALRMGKALTVGAGYFPDLPRTRTLVVWGANPPKSMPPFEHQVVSKAGADHNLIVIDPVRTELAARATVHLQVLPGTDGALALGMLRLVLQEGLYDREIAESQTVGFEDLRALVDPWDLDRTAEVTTVPRELVERTTRLLASERPTAIWDGLGIEHHQNGLQTIRAVAALQGLLGDVETPGGVALFAKAGPHFATEPLPQLFLASTPQPVPPTPEKRPIGYDEFPLYDVYNRQAQANLYADAILEDKPYPLRALLLVGCNAFVTWPGSARMRKAADRLKLLVSIDPFLTASGELSDYVLPAATFAEAVEAPLESEARSNLVREQHEAWPDWKIFFELGRSLGLGEYFPWKSFREALTAPRTRWMVDPQRQPTPLADAPAVTRFPTYTGKLELKSALMERFGLDPLPRWEPPHVMTSAEFPLWLVSGGRTRNFVNSQFHNIHSISQNAPEPFVEIHPSAAQIAGIADGQRGAVISPHGRIELRVRVTDRVHPRTAVLPAGWARANANLLTNGAALDPISGFPAMRSGVCRVERAV
jgi:anaerobic selenocysteine-containing dehydrogenase